MSSGRKRDVYGNCKNQKIGDYVWILPDVIQGVHVCICMCLCVWESVCLLQCLCVCVCVCVCVDISVAVSMYVWMFVCLCICTGLFQCVSVYVSSRWIAGWAAGWGKNMSTSCSRSRHPLQTVARSSTAVCFSLPWASPSAPGDHRLLACEMGCPRRVGVVTQGKAYTC